MSQKIGHQGDDFSVNGLLKKIEHRQALVGIVGLGYVGLPLAREFLKQGFSVLGYDIDQSKVEKIERGESYIKHIGTDFLEEHALRTRRLKATSDPEKLAEPDFLLICVPTPLGHHNDPDLSFVLDTTEMISRTLRPGQVIVLESTTYPGTTEEEMYPILSKSGLREGQDFFLGYSPEREDPGNPNFDTGSIPKVVSAMTPAGLALIEALYATIVATVPVSSPKVAESSKILENTYRAVNIALVNELKVVLARLGIDVWEVIDAAKTKPFGFHAFYPGPGLGGHCIPIDPFYLTWKAREVEYPTRFIELAGEINSNQPYYVVNNALNQLGRLGIAWSKAKTLVCGVAYKPDIDDIRESPALKIIDLLEQENADVSYHDPYIPVIPKTRKYNMHKKSVDLSTCEEKQFDLIIIVTDHKVVDYHRLLNLGRVIVDTRNALASRGLYGSHVFKS